jgi:hypothetical protein
VARIPNPFALFALFVAFAFSRAAVSRRLWGL